MAPPSRQRFHHSVTPEESGKALGRVLALRLKLPPRGAEALVASGNVRLNGKRARNATAPVLAGDVLEGHLGAPKPVGFHVVHDDAALLVVHKGPGLLSVPDRTPTPALSTALAAFLAQEAGKPVPVHPVHRLDKDVSGLLIFARTAAIRDAFRDQFADGDVERRYLAVIRGRMRERQGTLRTHLDTSLDRPRPVAPGRGALAVTHYETLAETELHSLLALRLDTGRKNQIRAQLAEANHAILGDRKFGGIEEAGFDRRRIALHAYWLRFEHPESGAEMIFSDPPPAAFKRMFPAFGWAALLAASTGGEG